MDYNKTLHTFSGLDKKHLQSLKKDLAKIVGGRYPVCICFGRFLLLYVQSQQLWSWRDGQFILPHIFLDKLEQAVNQYFVHILLLVTDNNPS